jgi:Raf kinase inhibitor-like YbhB/YbcL family protein
MRANVLSIAAAITLSCASAQAMELSSSSIANGASLAADQVKDGCGGKNISPALTWSGEPAGTKSFAITAYDPDAHGGWWHWAVVDIPAAVQSLPAGAGSGAGLPQGAVQSENSFGDAAYGGACPPPGSGPHHYEFAVWALPTASVAVDAHAKAEDVAIFLKSHALASATIIAIYER